MSIQVVSNSAPVAESSAVKDAKETKPAPAENTAEQTNASESGAEETEAKEENEQEEDDAEGDETEEGSESKDESSDKPKKKSGAQRRKERAERAEAEVQRLRRLLEDVALKGADAPKPEKAEKAPEAKGKPNPDDYDTHVEYVEALTDWKLAERDRKAEQSRLEVEQDKRLKSHSERVKAFAEKNEDFHESLEALDGIKSVTIEHVIVESEHGPALLYELAKNPKEAKRIAALPPIAAAREMGKLEAKVAAEASQEKKPEPKKTTNAPKPISPVGGGKGAVEKSINDPNLSQAEYEAIRRKQIAARKGSW